MKYDKIISIAMLIAAALLLVCVIAGSVTQYMLLMPEGIRENLLFGILSGLFIGISVAILVIAWKELIGED